MSIDIITIKDVLQILKEKYGFLLSSNDKKAMGLIRTWINRGIIEPPIMRIGAGDLGGRVGLYSIDLPLQIAAIQILRRKYNLPLKDIKQIKDQKSSLWNETIKQLTASEVVK
jgi:hypothetical protein